MPISITPGKSHLKRRFFEVKKFGRIQLAIILLVSSVVCFTSLACDNVIVFKVKNQTQTNLKIFYGDTFIGDDGPGKTLKFKTYYHSDQYFPIIAKTTIWNVVYAINVTRNDIIGKRTYEIIIPASAVK